MLQNFTLEQADTLIKQYQEDMELDSFEEALEELGDCFDLITNEYKLAYLMYQC